MFLRSAILTDAFGALAVRAVGVVLMFCSTSIAARMFGAEEYGTFASSLSLAMLLAALAPLGTDRVLARNLSIQPDESNAAKEISLTIRCTLMVAVVLLTLMLTASAWSTFLNGDSRWFQMQIQSAIIFVPLAMMYLRQWVAIPLVGTRKALVADQIVLPLMFLVSMVIAATASIRLTANLAAVLYVVSITIAFAISLHAGTLRSLYAQAVRLVLQPHTKTVLHRLREGLPFATVSIGGVISQTCMPVMIAATCGFRDAAFFGLAFSYATIPLLPLGVFNLSLIPPCSRHFKNGETLKAEHAIRSAATITFLLSACISVVIWFCSPLLIRILGTEYLTIVSLLPTLLLAAMMDCFTGPTVPVMQTMGMEKFYTRAMLFFVPAQLLLVYAAGKIAGVEGTAAGYLIARCCWNITIAVQIYRILGLRMFPYLNVRIAMRFSDEHRPMPFPVPRNIQTSELQLRPDNQAA